jgi:hypothetical protein
MQLRRSHSNYWRWNHSDNGRYPKQDQIPGFSYHRTPTELVEPQSSYPPPSALAIHMDEPLTMFSLSDANVGSTCLLLF